MSAASNYLESEWIKYAFTTTAMGTRPTAWYIALHTSDPGETGTTAECAYSGYARVAATWTQASNQVSNTGTVTFGAQGGASPVTITHFSVFDALTSGNCLYKGPLDLGKTFNQNDVPNFGVGEIILNVD